MPPPNPAQKLFDAPYADLVVVLLKQFTRLLKAQQVTLTTPQLTQVGEDAEAKQSSEDIDRIRPLLRQFVQESVNELHERFEFTTYYEALTHDMTAMDGWETTGEFLEIANIKSNAELRISAASTLLVMFGERTYGTYLLDIIRVDAGVHDVDAAFAIRALVHTGGITYSKDPFWFEAIEKWIKSTS